MANLKLKTKPVVIAAVVVRPAEPAPPVKAVKPAKPPKAPKPAPVKTPEQEAAEQAQLERMRLAKRQWIDHTLAVMQVRWPALFPDDDAEVRYPWAIRLRQAIYQALLEDRYPYTRTTIAQAIELWLESHQAAYQALLARGGPRYGLDMQPAGEVTEKERSVAERRQAIRMD